jgi:hypothetical protein
MYAVFQEFFTEFVSGKHATSPMQNQIIKHRRRKTQGYNHNHHYMITTILIILIIFTVVGLPSGCYTVQGVLPAVYKIGNFKIDSERSKSYSPTRQGRKILYDIVT